MGLRSEEELLERLRSGKLIEGVETATEAYVEVHCQGAVSPDDLRASFHKVPEVHVAATVSGPSR